MPTVYLSVETIAVDQNLYDRLISQGSQGFVALVSATPPPGGGGVGAGGFPSLEADPATPVDGQVWYRSDLDVYRVRRNGVTEDLLTSAYDPNPAAVPILEADPESPQDGQIWYRSDIDQFAVRSNGTTRYLLDSTYSPPDPGGGSGGNPATSPSELLNLSTAAGRNHFNLGIGQAASTHIDISPETLQAGYSKSPYFVLNAAKTAARMRQPVNGGKTSQNTSYARVELREFNDNNERMFFDCRTGTHYIKGHTKLLHLPPDKPWVVVAQMHSGSVSVSGDDTIKIMTRVVSGQLKLVATVGTNAGVHPNTLKDTIAVGDEFDWEIRLVNGTLTISIDGVVKITDASTFDTESLTQYFKAGCYGQSNTTTETDDNEYFEIELSELEHWHTGWATPVPFAGGGGSSGDTAGFEVVSADPGSPDDGAAWYREDTDQFRGRRGGASESFITDGNLTGSWNNLTMSNANVVSRTGGYPTVAVRREGNGNRVFFRGGLEATGANANGAVLATVPAGFRPPAGSFEIVLPGRHKDGTAVLTINEAGEIKLANAFNSGAPNNWLTLDNVNYPLT